MSKAPRDVTMALVGYWKGSVLKWLRFVLLIKVICVWKALVLKIRIHVWKIMAVYLPILLSANPMAYVLNQVNNVIKFNQQSLL